MSRLSLAHLQHRSKGDYIKRVFEEKDAFQVAGLMTLVGDDPIAIRQLWDLLTQEVQGLKAEKGEANIGEPKYYGIATYPKDWEMYGEGDG